MHSYTDASLGARCCLCERARVTSGQYPCMQTVCSNSVFFSPHFFSLVDTVWGARTGEKGGKNRVLFKLMTAVAANGNYWKEYIKQHRSVYPPPNPLFQHQKCTPILSWQSSRSLQCTLGTRGQLRTWARDFKDTAVSCSQWREKGRKEREKAAEEGWERDERGNDTEILD